MDKVKLADAQGILARVEVLRAEVASRRDELRRAARELDSILESLAKGDEYTAFGLRVLNEGLDTMSGML